MSVSVRNKKPTTAWGLVGVTLGLMIGASLFLSKMQRAQRLGVPGVKLEARAVYDDTGAIFATNAVYLPRDLPGYQATNPPIGRVEIDWLPKDTTFGRVIYRSTNGFQAMMSAVLMGADRTSIHKPEYCLVGQGFRIDSQQPATIAIREPVAYDLPIMKMVTSRDLKLPDGSTHPRRAIYLFWFVADGKLAADHNKRMVTMAVDMILTGVLQRWAYISCLAECEPGQEELLSAEMERLIAAAVPRFQLATGAPAQVARKD